LIRIGKDILDPDAEATTLALEAKEKLSH